MCHRLIPAHAGKTARRNGAAGRPRAHPRSRGENPPTLVKPSSAAGSSPLTRGKLALNLSHERHCRLIPAHAGKTSDPLLHYKGHTAHPRSRGENERLMVRYRIESGSSPLTRGKRVDSLSHGKRDRLIPAHAGKTSSRRSAATSSAAHPRSRGENPWGRRFRRHHAGSSPLTRGKLLPDQERLRLSRLIPAHAGKT